MDADALWRAIDAARLAGCREGALQLADKKLADITTPNWWQRGPDEGGAALSRTTTAPPFGTGVPVVEAVLIESGPPQGGDKGAAPEASGSSSAATAAGAEGSEKWYPGKYVRKAVQAIFN